MVHERVGQPGSTGETVLLFDFYLIFKATSNTAFTRKNICRDFGATKLYPHSLELLLSQPLVLGEEKWEVVVDFPDLGVKLDDIHHQHRSIERKRGVDVRYEYVLMRFGLLLCRYLLILVFN